MDKLDFMNMVSEVFEQCNSKEEIESRAKEMIRIIKTKELLSIQYLKHEML